MEKKQLIKTSWSRANQTANIIANQYNIIPTFKIIKSRVNKRKNIRENVFDVKRVFRSRQEMNELAATQSVNLVAVYWTRFQEEHQD